jgi:hypothetical protein
MKRMVLLVLFVLLVGVTASTAYSESPIIITPFHWSTGLLENGTSKSTTFTVQNGGEAPLIIQNIRLKTNSSSFSIAPSTPLPATLPPDGVIQVEVTFTSAGEGVHRASIEVDYTESSP